MKDKILLGIMLFGMIFYFIIAPIIIAHGFITGKIDIKTMRLATYEEQYEEMGEY